MPGARTRCTRRLPLLTGTVQSVLTGTIGSNTVHKLTAFGLHKYVDFEVGGATARRRVYPSQSPPDLAQGQAKDKYGAPFSAVLIGDSTRDVQAARIRGRDDQGRVGAGREAEELTGRPGAGSCCPPCLRTCLEVVTAVARSTPTAMWGDHVHPHDPASGWGHALLGGVSEGDDALGSSAEVVRDAQITQFRESMRQSSSYDQGYGRGRWRSRRFLDGDLGLLRGHQARPCERPGHFEICRKLSGSREAPLCRKTR